MKYLRISSKVESRLEEMKRSGKLSAGMAQKAERILEGIKSGDMLQWVQSNRMVTKYGEKRIRGCRKYDLGAGYRLITIHRESNIYVPFIGPHDECCRWIETNSKLGDVMGNAATVVRIENDDEEDDELWFSDDDQDEEIEWDECLRQVSDDELRTVFSGLIDGLKK